MHSVCVVIGNPVSFAASAHALAVNSPTRVNPSPFFHVTPVSWAHLIIPALIFVPSIPTVHSRIYNAAVYFDVYLNLALLNLLVIL